MQQAPFDERHEVVHIYTYNISFHSDFWTMNSKDKDKGSVSLSRFGTIYERFMDAPDYKQLATDAVLILRNQSDYSNIISIIGTFSIESMHERIGAPRMIFLLADYLFEKAKEYITETNLTGADGKQFIMPAFNYTDDCFKNIVKED